MNTDTGSFFHMETGKKIIFLLCMIISLIFLPCCGTVFNNNMSSSEGTAEETELRVGPVPVYYDFDDISVPPDLALDKKRSYIYETNITKNGILVFKGRIDVNSLVSFFKTNMPRDNWVFISSYKYKDYILNFRKGGKNCLITLYDKLFNTVVEIRVGSINEEVERPEQP